MKRKTRFLSLCLFFALFLSVFPMDTVSGASETTYEDVTKYTYELTPILSPFLYAIYVKTENPDPTSFRFVDRDTVYATEDAPEGYYVLQPRHFADVLYENEEIYRVKGGYIFYNGQGMPDGGKLVLQQKTGDGGGTTVIWGGGSDVVMTGEYEDTNVTVTCPKLQSGADYLIEHYTVGLTDFFEKMDAVQSALNKLAVYPRPVQDSSRPTGKYPALAASGYYPELGLNKHYELLYQNTDGLLLSISYPFVLDSLGMPGMMRTVANTLDPSVIVSAGLSHPFINVTKNGTTKTYGGVGYGGDDPLYTKHVNKWFTFQYDAQDFLNSGTIDSYLQKLVSFVPLANADAAEHRDLIAGETFRNTIAATGGTWIRIAVEYFFSTGTSYAYALPMPYGYTEVLTDAWVDGRYIGNYEMVEVSAVFADHPTSDIVIRQMQYTDYDGESHTQDVLFRYDEDADIWEAENYYDGPYQAEAPDVFYMTRQEVEEMQIDRYTVSAPEKGLIYDGTAYPGTQFQNVLVTGVETQEALQIDYQERKELLAIVLPENATYQDVEWSSSDESVAVIEDEYDFDSECYRYYVKGVKTGTAELTVKTLEGAATASCTVTVLENYAGKCGENVTFMFNSKTGVLTISGEGPLDEYGYYSPRANPFYEIRDKIKTVVVTDGVTSLSAYAFRDCSVLEEITLPASIERIPYDTFLDCKKLAAINVNGSGSNFSSRDGVLFNSDFTVLALYPQGRPQTEYPVPDGVTAVGAGAFKQNRFLQRIFLPDSIAEIKDWAFEECEGLATINIPENAKVGESIFYNCQNLLSVDVADDNPYVADIDGVLFSKDFGKLIQYPCGKKDTSYSIPDGVATVEHSAFRFNKSLQEIVFPDSLTKIDDAAFQDCTALTSLLIKGNVGYIGSNSFRGCVALIALILTEGVQRLGDGAFAECTALTEVYLPETLKEINKWAFLGCSSLARISVQQKVTQIGFRAFYECGALKDIYYTGTQEQWDQIKVDSENYGLNNAELHLHKHVYDNVETVKIETCAVEGLDKQVCTECGFSKYDVIQKKAHVMEKTNEKKATCTEAGNVEYYTCSVCKKTFSDAKGTKEIKDVTLKATGHSFGRWIVTKEATTAEEGVEARMCSKCGEEETRPIAIIEITQMLGDVDGNGEINSADARLALRCAVDLEDYPQGSREFYACDVNKDGEITSADARKILRAAVELEDPADWQKQ